MFASALDQCRWSDFWFWEFLENEQQFSLFDWLIDWRELIDFKVWSKLALQSAKMEKVVLSAGQSPATIHVDVFMWISCGFHHCYLDRYLDTWRKNRQSFFFLSSQSQGANLSDAERAVKELDKQSCAVTWRLLAPIDHLGNGQIFFLANFNSHK